jgi:hypothetical protein
MLFIDKRSGFSSQAFFIRVKFLSLFYKKTRTSLNANHPLVPVCNADVVDVYLDLNGHELHPRCKRGREMCLVIYRKNCFLPETKSKKPRSFSDRGFLMVDKIESTGCLAIYLITTL